MTLLRYIVSEDCGAMINPAWWRARSPAGWPRASAACSTSTSPYDEAGNPLATTFLDYLLPTAAEVPPIEFGHIETPSPTPGGFKGMGEGGAIGAPPAVVNAVAGRAGPLGARLTRQPLTPSALLSAMSRRPNRPLTTRRSRSGRPALGASSRRAHGLTRTRKAP